MIKVLCRQGRLGDATELLTEMADNGCSPDECTYNTIIKAFLNANDVPKALDYLDRMRGQGLAADDNTASLFLGLLTNPHVNDVDKALLQKYFLEHHDRCLIRLSHLHQRSCICVLMIPFYLRRSSPWTKYNIRLTHSRWS
ncbi:hypothetical protein RND81_11G017300 [Saponaria officinalis]|uniref:Pentatricopeptide repeat-containing protein n=1 Tax=Saponaria officinalis TaxID=3572 RepID=A0AAW1HG56_SAPOF